MSKIPLGVLITTRSISLIYQNKPYNINDSHPNFESIKHSLLNKDYSNLENILDLPKFISQKLSKFPNTDLEIVEDVVQYQGYPIHDTLSDKLIEDLENGYDIKGFSLFVNNLMQNPSNTAIKELYLFIQKANLPITDDGCFLAYKKVNENYKDIHTDTFDNSVGKICQMPRNQVDDVRDNTCSNGLHFCSYEYLPCFGTGPGNKVVIVKINPKDVVSIPSDYNDTKGRTCKYEVIGEVENWEESDVFQNAHGSQWDLPNDYDDSDFEYDEDYDNCDENDYNGCIQDDDENSTEDSISEIEYSTGKPLLEYKCHLGSYKFMNNQHTFRNSTGHFITASKAKEIGLIDEARNAGVSI